MYFIFYSYSILRAVQGGDMIGFNEIISFDHMGLCIISSKIHYSTKLNRKRHHYSTKN